MIPKQNRPKISTMPRRKCESTDYLHKYQLAVEKDRLQQDLQQVEHRRYLINQRLQEIDRQMASLNVQKQLISNSDIPIGLKPNYVPQPSPDSKEFQTMMLEY